MTKSRSHSEYCPVCGFYDDEYRADYGSICGACGTELGVSDRVLSHADLFRRWVVAGCPFFDQDMLEPPRWRAHCVVLQQAWERSTSALLSRGPDDARTTDGRLREP